MGSAGVDADAAGNESRELSPEPETSVDGPSGPPGGREFAVALGLTVASAVVWGVAHFCTGRRVAGALLLTAYTAVVATLVVIATRDRTELATMAVQSKWLDTVTVCALLLALAWAGVVVWSYVLVRPQGMPLLPRVAGVTAVVVLCAAVCTPLVYTAKISRTTKDTLGAIFPSGSDTPRINESDPFNGRQRVNIALLASDSAWDRTGTRTDSVTVASIDTRTGDTVLIGLPRNLEHVPMPPGPARNAFPDGFTGDGPENPGLLNEVFEYAENHPDMVPGVPDGRRGPTLVSQTIAEILGQPIDYYVLVDMFGFADIVDAMGGIRLRIVSPIPYGEDGGVLQPGDRVLSGKEALWYSRSRNETDDYVRMGRQKCLLRALARQADPGRILTKFEQLASATRRAIATNIPQALLPALVKLSAKAKDGAKISNLSFVPPLISTGNPDYALIRRLSAQAIGENRPSASPSASASASGSPAAGPSAGSSSSATPSPSAQPSAGSQYDGIDTSGTAAQGKPTPVSLDSICPS
jgi:anionic cell wall polymer biosynthesis LytR-Cps2A-Psr (LCP) family protein